ncbi:MAG TPA: phage tail tube protein [Allosphingosinicella sp.]|jgi:hypothetical protein
MPDTLKTILFKKETTYGTDAAPTTAANAVVTRNFSAEPIVVDQLERKLDTPSRGRRKSSPTNRRTAFGYELEMAGSGAAGTAAPWMEHLECCGMAAPVLTAATKAEQKFAAAGAALSAGTCHHWMGGQRARGLGSRGTFGVDFTAGAVPFAKVDMQAILPPSPAIDGTAPVGNPDFTRWLEPLEVNTANTDFLLDGFAAVLKQFTLDANAEVKPRNLVGANYIQRGDHAMTGRVICEAPALASKNYFTTLDVGTEIATQLVHGTVAGNIIQVDTSYLQILKITRTEEDDVMMLDISVGLNIRNGQDDLLLTAK